MKMDVSPREGDETGGGDGSTASGVTEEEWEDLVDDFHYAARCGELEEVKGALAALEEYQRRSLKPPTCCCCSSCSSRLTHMKRSSDRRSSSSFCNSASVRSSSSSGSSSNSSRGIPESCPGDGSKICMSVNNINSNSGGNISNSVRGNRHCSRVCNNASDNNSLTRPSQEQQQQQLQLLPCTCCCCSPVNARDSRGGLTALHMAAANGHVSVAEYLIAAGAQHLPNYSGNTPLHWAVTNKHVAIVKLLLGSSTMTHGTAATTAPTTAATTAATPVPTTAATAAPTTASTAAPATAATTAAGAAAASSSSGAAAFPSSYCSCSTAAASPSSLDGSETGLPAASSSASAAAGAASAAIAAGAAASSHTAEVASHPTLSYTISKKTSVSSTHRSSASASSATPVAASTVAAAPVVAASVAATGGGAAAGGGGGAAAVSITEREKGNEEVSLQKLEESSHNGELNNSALFVVDVLQRNSVGKSALSEGFNCGDSTILQLLLEHPSAQQLEEAYDPMFQSKRHRPLVASEGESTNYSKSSTCQNSQTNTSDTYSASSSTKGKSNKSGNRSSGSTTSSSTQNTISSGEGSSTAGRSTNSSSCSSSTKSYRRTDKSGSSSSSNRSSTGSVAAANLYAGPGSSEKTEGLRSSSSSGLPFDSNNISLSATCVPPSTAAVSLAQEHLYSSTSDSSNTTNTKELFPPCRCAAESCVLQTVVHELQLLQEDEDLVFAQEDTKKKRQQQLQLQQQKQQVQQQQQQMQQQQQQREQQQEKRECGEGVHAPDVSICLEEGLQAAYESSMQRTSPYSDASVCDGRHDSNTSSTDVAAVGSSDASKSRSRSSSRIPSSNSSSSSINNNEGEVEGKSCYKAREKTLFVRELGLSWTREPFEGDNPAYGDTTGVHLWTAAVVGAQWVARLARNGEFAHKSVLEVGAGCGLVGMAAAHFSAAPLKRLLLTDVFPHALDNMKICLRLNNLLPASEKSRTNDTLTDSINNSSILTLDNCDSNREIDCITGTTTTTTTGESGSSDSLNLGSSTDSSSLESSRSSSNTPCNRNCVNSNICKSSTSDSSTSDSGTCSGSTNDSSTSSLNRSSCNRSSVKGRSIHVYDGDCDNQFDSSSGTHSNSDDHTGNGCHTNSADPTSREYSTSSGYPSHMNIYTGKNEDLTNTDDRTTSGCHTHSGYRTSTACQSSSDDRTDSDDRMNSGKPLEVDVASFDWSAHPTSWPEGWQGGWDVVVGSDLVYEHRTVQPLAAAVAQLLQRPSGVFYYVHRLERQGAGSFVDELRRCGLTCDVKRAPEEFFANPFVHRSEPGSLELCEEYARGCVAKRFRHVYMGMRAMAQLDDDAELCLPELRQRDFELVRCSWQR